MEGLDMTTEQKENLEKKMEELLKLAKKFNEVSYLAECVGMGKALEMLGYKVETNVDNCTASITEQ